MKNIVRKFFRLKIVLKCVYKSFNRCTHLKSSFNPHVKPFKIRLESSNKNSVFLFCLNLNSKKECISLCNLNYKCLNESLFKLKVYNRFQ